ncbi:MAG: phosphocholine cytidylyltransferase family protein [FCB group bacterium]|nr:phosphocholine cytidylyltransferase family protein [FCB group bacterium]
MTKALILAAGVSRRLYPLTYSTPKTLLSLGNRRIIDYQLRALADAQIRDCVVITGYYREKLEDYLLTAFPDFRFQFIVNQHFFETNTAYSLLLARKAFQNQEDMVLMNADVLFPSALLKRVIAAPTENTLAVEIKPCGNEEVKVIDGGENRVVAIGKKLIQENALGEFIGVARLSGAFVEPFFHSLNHLIEAGGDADYFEAGLHPLLDDHPVHYTDVSDLPCLEIDFKDDLDRARELISSGAI